MHARSDLQLPVFMPGPKRNQRSKQCLVDNSNFHRANEILKQNHAFEIALKPNLVNCSIRCAF